MLSIDIIEFAVCVENVDTDEAKGFFEGNFSHVYFILYDSFVTAETNLRQRGNFLHKLLHNQMLLLMLNFKVIKKKTFFYAAKYVQNCHFISVSQVKIKD